MEKHVARRCLVLLLSEPQKPSPPGANRPGALLHRGAEGLAEFQREVLAWAPAEAAEL